MSQEVVSAEERYCGAINSSALLLREMRTGDVDVLIAAALASVAANRQKLRSRKGVPLDWCQADQALATLLFRLRIEWDGVQTMHGMALQFQRQRDDAVAQASQELADMEQAQERDEAAIERAAEELKLLKASNKTTADSDHALMLQQLRTLAPVRNALYSWAMVHASKWPVRNLPPNAKPAAVRQAMLDNPVGDDAAVRNITARVLRAWLRPRCQGCGGTKLVFPASGKPGKSDYKALQIRCGACRGTGLAREGLGESDGEKRFAQHLLDRMDEITLQVGEHMHRMMPTVRRAKELLRVPGVCR